MNFIYRKDNGLLKWHIRFLLNDVVLNCSRKTRNNWFKNYFVFIFFKRTTLKKYVRILIGLI